MTSTDQRATESPAPALAFELEPDASHTRLTRGRLARALVAAMTAPMQLRIIEPGGGTLGGGDADSPVVTIHDMHAYRRLESHPKIGLGEAYLAGEWGPGAGTDLVDVLIPFAERLDRLLPESLLRLRRIVDRQLPHHHRNTLDGSRANIAAHYDLSNDLFAAFLDPTMTYSSALFDPAQPFDTQDLAKAQHRKIDAALDAAGVGSGSRVLEIGTGWGELALRAALRGATVRSITLSAEQQAYAIDKLQRAGVADRVEVAFEDYRQVRGVYDAVISIEMIEAVGDEYWPTYFHTLDRVLRPGGMAVVQAILMAHDRYLATRTSYGWIQKYIFPGGIIPSREAIAAVVAEHTQLKLVHDHAFGAHYAHTLARWRAAFDAATPQLKSLGFDERFARMWEFYLAYSQAGFATGYLDVAQLAWKKAP